MINEIILMVEQRFWINKVRCPVDESKTGKNSTFNILYGRKERGGRRVKVEERE